MKKQILNSYQEALTSEKSDLREYVQCVDHTVSRETFQLIHESENDLLMTCPQPEQDELADYYKSEDYISHTDSRRSLFEKAYHLIRTYSLKKKLSILNKYSPSKGKLLDVGCGTGDFLRTCQADGWEVSGIEPNPQAQNIAREKLPGKSQLFKEIDDLILDGSQKFNVISLWHVLEHIPNLLEFIDKLKSLLKPDGLLIIAVPNFKSFDATYYKKYWAAFDVPRHLWHFSETSIRNVFGNANMKVVQTLPMKFDSFYVSLLSEKYKTGSSNPIHAFWIGLKSNRKAKRDGAYSSLIYLIENTN